MEITFEQHIQDISILINEVEGYLSSLPLSSKDLRFVLFYKEGMINYLARYEKNSDKVIQKLNDLILTKREIRLKAEVLKESEKIKDLLIAFIAQYSELLKQEPYQIKDVYVLQ